MRTVRLKESGQALPVGKILCLGRNYPEHIREMNAEIPQKPVVFLKPATAIVSNGGNVVIPPYSREVHFEVEMVILIGKEGKNIQAREAFEYVAGYGVGLDMTLRDLQAEAKKRGLPWSVAKAFDTSAPISDITGRDAVEDPHDLELSLLVNGTLRQHSNTRHMLFRVDQVISYLSSVFTLERGDVIFTGTPEGVGAVTSGDVLEATLASVAALRVTVV